MRVRVVEGPSDRVVPSAGSSKRTWARAIGSVLIALHLLAVWIAPNKDTPIGRMIKPLLDPYLDGLELAANWNFFSPDPGMPLYVEWELVNSKGETYSSGMMPEFRNPYFLRERQNRRMVAARFIGVNDERLVKVLSLYLCDHHPEAASLRIWSSSIMLPSPQEVASGKKPMADVSSLNRRMVANHYCEGRKG